MHRSANAFPRIIVLLSAAAIFVSCAGPLQKSTCEIHFIVDTETPLPPDQTVYISGNMPQLGMWDADGHALVRTSDSRWELKIKFPVQSVIEYKFTKGSWGTEAMEAECIVPNNFTLTADRSRTVTAVIELWRDECDNIEVQVTGLVEYHREFPSAFLELDRDVLVWLPPGYHNSNERYPVLYMHDGQNIVDPGTSYIGTDWQVDEVATELIESGQMEKIIIVGMSSTDNRRPEYSPIQLGGDYTRFVIEEVIPFINRSYRTLTGPENTAVMGSSMGGIISFHMAWEHSETFGYAGCLSPAFLVDEDEILHRIRAYRGPLKEVKFYLDNGTVGLEAELDPGFREMAEILRSKGYTDDGNLLVFVDEGAVHNEIAWARRVHKPLLFFFGKQ